MPSLHARISPSALARILRCHGSVEANEAIPEKRDSFYSAEGTAAHDVRETCLLLGLEPEDFLGDVLTVDGFEIEVSEEMVEALRPGIERLRDRPGRMWVEEQVTFDRWLPGQFGTLDTGVVSKDLIEINDLKYGAGVPVSPVENEQLMGYALAFWDNIARHISGAETFLLVIDQPRAKGGGGEWEVSLSELLEYGDRLRDLFETLFPDPLGVDPWAWELATDLPRAAGEKQCQFCKAKAVCPTLAQFSFEAMALEFEDFEDDEPEMPSLQEFTPEQRALVARHKGLITSWIDAVHAHVLADAVNGHPTPGLKAVDGRRGPRKWKDEQKAERFLLRRIPREKVRGKAPLITPTAAEKLLSKAAVEKLGGLVTQSDPKPVLVDESDPKPALSMADEFEDIED